MQYGPFFFNIFHALVNSAPLLAQIHDCADILGSHHDFCFYHGFLHIFDLRRVRHICRIGQVLHFPVCLVHLVNNAGGCGNQVQIVFPLQTLLYNLQMEKAQKAAPESKSQSRGSLGLKLKRRVVKLQFLQSISQIRVFCPVCRIKAAVYHRIYFLISGQRFRTGVGCISNCIAHPGFFYIFQAGSDIAYHSRFQFITRDKLSGSKGSYFHHLRPGSGSHHKHRRPFSDRSFLNAAEYDYSFVGIINRIKNQRLEGS